MVKIDYTELIEAAAKEIKDHLPTSEQMPQMSRRAFYIYRRFHNGDITPMSFNEIQKAFVGRVWKDAVSMIAASHVVKDPLSAEKLLLSLKRRDVLRADVEYGNGRFNVKLDNWRYRLYKKVDGVRVLPETLYGDYSESFYCHLEDLADFIIDFDAHMPEINSKAQEVHKAHMAEVLEMQKVKKAAEIREKAVHSLVNQFLKPLGIGMTFQFNSDGTIVRAHLRKELTLDLEVPFEQLAATLKDTEDIKSRMK